MNPWLKYFGFIILSTTFIWHIEGQKVLTGEKATESHSDAESRPKRQLASLSAAEQQEALKVHNDYRSGEGANAMEYMVIDQFLVQLAQDWADECKFDHGLISRTGQPFTTIGQNLFLGVNTQTLNIEFAIEKWFDEKEYYNFDTGECDSGQVCGHYTQLIWAKSRAVGCGAKYCATVTETVNGAQRTHNNAVVFVCDYGPAGNVVNQRPYVVGPACTACESGVYSCLQKLCKNPCTESDCTCNAKCQNCGTVFDNCTCNCANNYMGKLCDKKCEDSSGCDPSWPVDYCNHPDAATAEGVRLRCNLLCGICELPDPSFICSQNASAVRMSPIVLMLCLLLVVLK